MQVSKPEELKLVWPKLMQAGDCQSRSIQIQTSGQIQTSSQTQMPNQILSLSSSAVSTGNSVGNSVKAQADKAKALI